MAGGPCHLDALSATYVLDAQALIFYCGSVFYIIVFTRFLLHFQKEVKSFIIHNGGRL